jgi:hypothetical protein
LWTGDLAAAERSIARMTDLAARDVLPGWIARARCYRGVLLVQQDRPVEGTAELRDGIQALRVSGSVAEYPFFASVLATVWAAPAKPSRRLPSRAMPSRGARPPPSVGASLNCRASSPG